jgi:hypothetical protein
MDTKKVYTYAISMLYKHEILYMKVDNLSRDNLQQVSN